MPPINASRLYGRVQRAIRPAGKARGYGFVLTDNQVKFFFHQDDVVGQLLPEAGSHVSFDVLPKSSPKLLDRAINVQIESVPQ